MRLVQYDICGDCEYQEGDVWLHGGGKNRSEDSEAIHEYSGHAERQSNSAV